MNRKYLTWLCNYINNEEDVAFNHSKLIKELYSTEYVFGNSSDCNRAKDGLALRGKYEMAGGKEMVADHLDGQCSVLEMLIALSIRIETEYLASREHGDRTSEWFWEMLDNAGLAVLSDGKWDAKTFEKLVGDAMVYVNNVTFFKNLSGCKYVGAEDLWHQMLAWVNDKLFESGVLTKNW